MRCILHKLLILLIFSMSGGLCSVAKASPRAKSEVLSRLQNLAGQNRGRIKEIDQEIRQMLMNTYNQDLSKKDMNTNASEMARRETQLERLTLQRKEHLLRQDFIDRLIFHVDTHFSGQNLKDFLHKQILNMAQIEATQAKSESSLWKFLSYLSLAVKELPEAQEDILGFVEGYMRFSTVLNPIRPHQFVLHRNYTNGVDSVSANDMDPTQVGEIVEQRLKEVQLLEEQKKRTFELRQPVLKPVAQSLTKAIKRDSLPHLENHYKSKTEALLPKDVVTGDSPTSDVLQLRFQMDQIHRKDETGGSPMSRTPRKADNSGDEFKVKLIPKESLRK